MNLAFPWVEKPKTILTKKGGQGQKTPQALMGKKEYYRTNLYI